MRFLRQTAPVLALLVLPLAGHAELVPRLVRDIDPTSYAGSSSPRQRAEINQGFAFTAFNGTELWTYDYTEDSFYPVFKRPEIRQVSGSLYAARASTGGWTFWNVKGWPYFSAEAASKTPVARLGAVYFNDSPFDGLLLLLFEANAGKGLGLWTLRDGDVRELARPLPLADGRLLHDLTFYRGRSYFVARHRRLGTALWVTDGTRAGTSPVFAPAPGQTVSMILVGQAGNRLLVAVSGPGNAPPTLWLSNGTPRGTRPLTKIGRGGPGAAITDSFDTASLGLPESLFLIADDGRHGRQLWTTDGTAAGTVPLTRFAAPDPFGPSPLTLGRLDGRVAFFADDGAHGRELWWSDGTAAGTEILADTCPGSCGTAGEVLGTLRVDDSSPERLLFSAQAPGHGLELWSTAGTAGETSVLGDFCPGSCNGDPRDLTINYYFLDLGYRAAFTAGTAEGKRALWISDGTPQGTERLTPPAVTVTYWDGALFTASDAAFGDEFWVTDGTPESTHLFKDLGREEDSGSYPAMLGAAGDRLIFTASDPTNGLRLWASDGTAAETVRLALPHPVPQFSKGAIGATAGGRTFFVVPPHGSVENALWATDGRDVARLTPPEVEVTTEAVAVGDRVVFFATDAEHGNELWVSDGTPDSTHLLIDLVPGAASVAADLSSLTVLHGQLVFRLVDDDEHLWRTDGTAAGTRRLIDVYPFLDPFDKQFYSVFTETGGKVFFVGATKIGGPYDVWVSDWTAAGTQAFGLPTALAQSVSGLFAAGSRLFIATSCSGAGCGDPGLLYVSDGTPGSGLVQVPATASFKDGDPTAVFGERLAFTDQVGAIWVTDGSPGGTFRLRDPAGEDIDVSGGQIVAFAGQLVFAGQTEGSCYVWDGRGATAAPAGSDLLCLGNFFPVGPRLYFTGVTPQIGAELWVFEEP